jgi:putative SOS response-associated peptidase YedK
MNSFVGQDGTIAYHRPTYGIREVMPFTPWPRIRPNTLVNLLVRGPEAVENHRGNWGMGTGRFDWNARDDRLSKSPLWKGLWLHPGNHVVIPLSHAFEATTRHGARQFHALKRRDDQPWWVPGLGRVQQGKYRTEWHVTMVTVDAGPVFAGVHDTPREIVCLRDWKEVTTWLEAADETGLRALLRPSTPDVLTSYRIHDDAMKPSFPAEKVAQPFEGA